LAVHRSETINAPQYRERIKLNERIEHLGLQYPEDYDFDRPLSPAGKLMRAIYNPERPDTPNPNEESSQEETEDLSKEVEQVVEQAVEQMEEQAAVESEGLSSGNSEEAVINADAEMVQDELDDLAMEVDETISTISIEM
jgi:hypothetical protein